MFLLRGLFWLGLVAYLVPYKMIDSPSGTLVIDESAIAARVGDLPRYCDHHGRVCAAAHDLSHALAVQGRAGLAYALSLQMHLN